MANEIQAFTDGACRGNPGPGGWGVLLRALGPTGEVLKETELKGGERHTTNNRMELMAAIQALEALTRPTPLVLTTDSRYVMQGITEWLARWKRNNWRTATRQPVKNADLWQRLDTLAQRHQVRWQWVKGHSGHAENDRVDALANQAIDALLAE